MFSLQVGGWSLVGFGYLEGFALVQGCMLGVRVSRLGILFVLE